MHMSHAASSSRPAELVAAVHWPCLGIDKLFQSFSESPVSTRNYGSLQEFQDCSNAIISQKL